MLAAILAVRGKCVAVPNGKLLQGSSVFIVKPGPQIVVPMKHFSVNSGKSMDFLNHVPVDIRREQCVTQVEGTKNRIGKFLVVAFGCSILTVRNSFVVHIVIAKIEERPEILKWCSRPVVSYGAAHLADSFPFLPCTQSVDCIQYCFR
jgi:hypothetical protein